MITAQGVDAGALTQGAALLSRPADEYENDTNVEAAWVVQACQYADVHFNLISSVDPKLLRLTAEDDRILDAFERAFPGAQLECLTEESLKSPAAKPKWREFLDANRDIPDYNYGTLLRLNSESDYNEENTTLVPRLQFLAIEISRNRKGLNDNVWKKSALIRSQSLDKNDCTS
ncbi:unnamed protein product [Allacma fusca]|uniref:Polysaccharide biosynthesis domain-containing protein n=1 Tax=Allacma fusca TaxID=39272 RepID=A0A8J2NRA7_9HEXA|nr:unnamed protein product [Allacma fusca]